MMYKVPMSNLSVAQKYARSVLGMVENLKELENIISELETLQTILNKFSNLENYLFNIWVSIEDKMQVWQPMSELMSKIVYALTIVMINNHRLYLLSDVILQLENYLCEKNGIMKVQVQTICRVDNKNKSKIVEMLEKSGKLIESSSFIVAP